MNAFSGLPPYILGQKPSLNAELANSGSLGSQFALEIPTAASLMLGSRGITGRLLSLLRI